MATNTLTRTAAIYCRISKHDGDGPSGGVTRQRADCEALAERRGWKVADVYVDDDRSAYSGAPRPEYLRMMRDVAEGRVDAVMAWHPDRLHRSPRELEDFIVAIEDTGAAVVTVTAGDYDLALPEGRLMARIVGSVARKESEDKSRRLRRKHQELAEAGAVSGGGRRPFGYEADRVTLRPSEAAEIADAARRILAGDTLRSVWSDWNERGVETVTGARWSGTTLKRLLMSGRISGQREHHGKLIGPAVWPAIITPEQTARLRAVLSDPQRNRGNTTVRSYLLTGLVYCGRCGSAMTSRPTGRGVRRYICSADRGGCGRCGIAAEGLEDLVVEAVLQRLDSPQMSDALARRSSARDVEIIDQSAEIEAQLDQLAKDHYVDRLIGRSEFLAARGALQERLEATRAKLAARTPSDVLDGATEGFRARWAELSFDRRRAVLAAVLDRVDVAPTERSNNRFDPSRVSVAYRD